MANSSISGGNESRVDVADGGRISPGTFSLPSKLSGPRLEYSNTPSSQIINLPVIWTHFQLHRGTITNRELSQRLSSHSKRSNLWICGLNVVGIKWRPVTKRVMFGAASSTYHQAISSQTTWRSPYNEVLPSRVPPVIPATLDEGQFWHCLGIVFPSTATPPITGCDQMNGELDPSLDLPGQLQHSLSRSYCLKILTRQKPT